MEIKIYPFKCPACGADLPITDFSRKVIFCSYCGTRLIIESDDDLAGAAVESNKEKGSAAGQATRNNINNGNSNGQTDKTIKGEYKSPKKKAESDWDGWDGWDEEESTGLEYFEDDPPEATGVQKLKGWAVDMLKEVLETPTTEERTYPSREKQPMKR